MHQLLAENNFEQYYRICVRRYISLAYKEDKCLKFISSLPSDKYTGRLIAYVLEKDHASVGIISVEHLERWVHHKDAVIASVEHLALEERSRICTQGSTRGTYLHCYVHLSGRPQPPMYAFWQRANIDEEAAKAWSELHSN